MLVLARKTGECIVVGNSIRIMVVASSAGSVRLGIEAPPDVSIYREEIYNEIANANRTAIDDPEPAPPGSGETTGR